MYNTFEAADRAAHEYVEAAHRRHPEGGRSYIVGREALIRFSQSKCTASVGAEIRRAWLGVLD